MKVYFADIYLKDLAAIDKWLYRMPFYGTYAEALNFYEALAILYGCLDDNLVLRSYVRVIEPLTMELNYG